MMKQFSVLIGLLLFSLSLWPVSIADYAGTYPLDIERSNGLRDDPEILKTVQLIIRADRSIGWGAGKWHELKLINDLNEKGMATYLESFAIKGKRYETEYLVQLHMDGYIEINCHFFKVRDVINKPDPVLGEK